MTTSTQTKPKRKGIRLLIICVVLSLFAVCTWYGANKWAASRLDIYDLIELGDVDGVEYVAKWCGTEQKPVVQLDQSEALLEKAGHRLGRTPLGYSVFAGKKEMVRILIEQGANPNATDKYGYTPLVTAIFLSNSEMCSVLLDGGADVNILYDKGHTVLHYASIHDLKKIVDLLIAHGAKPDLNIYAGLGNVQEMRKLLAGSVDINKHIIGTPLLWAVRNGKVDAVNLLLKHKADIERPDDFGDTPLSTVIEMATSKTGRPVALEICKSLIDAGGNVDAQRGKKEKWSLLHAAAVYSLSSVVKLLLDAGAKINVQDYQGHTPLDAAMVPTSGKPDKDLIKLLKARGGKRGSELK